ncbi:hypothetical protein R4282_06725 [Rhodococcus oxybenzonivorans]|uniref:hypothetical protein n=1 Tax=Rhodococcus oxybenzonivorans TaxID=1990687 RepID=UPI0029540BFF|nr:hypothetical protein [Rhodococcus oxybenzonivorans]MDV7352707.1 hypothetical protein [Rhodococcus oxybenzonivorans]
MEVDLAFSGILEASSIQSAGLGLVADRLKSTGKSDPTAYVALQLHGGGQIRRSLRRPREPLEAAALIAYAVDPCGHGSTGGEAGHYGISDMIEDVHPNIHHVRNESEMNTAIPRWHRWEAH